MTHSSLLIPALLSFAFVAPSPEKSRTVMDDFPMVRMVDQPKPVRLRVEIRMLSPTWEGGAGNSEDEILYAVAWKPAGQEARGKVVRPWTSPDIWEMGHRSARRLQRLVFEGNVAPAKPARIAIAVAEQEGSTTGVQNPLLGSTLTPFDDDLADEVMDALDRDDGAYRFERVVATQVTLAGDKMTVVPASFSRVVTSTPQFALIETMDADTHYELRLFVESAEGSRPEAPVFLGLEDDDCSEPDLWVHKQGGGRTHVSLGQTKKVIIANKEFAWDCGDSDEEAVARPGTEFLEVVRDKTGDEILWKCFDVRELVPDITW